MAAVSIIDQFIIVAAALLASVIYTGTTPRLFIIEFKSLLKRFNLEPVEITWPLSVSLSHNSELGSSTDL